MSLLLILGAVTVKIKNDQQQQPEQQLHDEIEEDKDVKKNHYFREIEELPEEELQKHNYEFYQSGRDKDLAQTIHNTIKHDKNNMFSPLKAARIFLNDHHQLVEMPKGVLYDGKRLPSTVTYVGHPFSRRKSHKSESDELVENSDEPQYHISSTYSESEPENDSSVDVHRYGDRDDINNMNTLHSHQHNVPEFPEDVNIKNSDNRKYVDNDSLLTMVHSVIKDSVKESKMFIDEKSKQTNKKFSNTSSILKYVPDSTNGMALKVRNNTDVKSHTDSNGKVDEILKASNSHSVEGSHIGGTAKQLVNKIIKIFEGENKDNEEEDSTKSRNSKGRRTERKQR